MLRYKSCLSQQYGCDGFTPASRQPHGGTGHRDHSQDLFVRTENRYRNGGCVGQSLSHTDREALGPTFPQLPFEPFPISNGMRCKSLQALAQNLLALIWVQIGQDDPPCGSRMQRRRKSNIKSRAGCVRAYRLVDNHRLLAHHYGPYGRFRCHVTKLLQVRVDEFRKLLLFLGSASPPQDAVTEHETPFVISLCHSVYFEGP